MKNKLAFTLVELIIVIALIGILLLIALPNSEYFNKLKEMAEIKEFRRDVLLARNKAIMESDSYTFARIEGGKGYKIKGVCGGYCDRKYFESGLRILGTNTIRFHPNGTVGGANTILFHDKNKRMYEMKITPVIGNVNIELVESLEKEYE